MKILMLSRSQVLTFSRFRALATLLLATAGLPTRGDTNFTSTGWLLAAPLPGITVTNSSGQVYLKGNAHVVRMESDNGLIAGRLQAWMDLAYQADGTALFSGPAYGEVGTWDAGTNFIPAGGVWALNYSGVARADGSSQYSMTGHGIGGNIEGLRVSGTAKRAAPGGPTDPYLISGMIKAAPVNTREVVDDFANNRFTWPACGVGPVPNPDPPGTFFASETNQQLTIGGTWPATTPRIIDSVAWADLAHPWAASAGQTLEARVDVIALSQTASATALGLYYTSGQAYFVAVGRNFIALEKEEWLGLAVFRVVQAPIKDTNIVLSLALTPVGGNVVLTGKVLDKANGDVIAQVVATDTPASDPTVSASELAQMTGGRLWQGIVADPVGAPHSSGIAPAIFVGQESDTAPVTAFATFDNLELRTYEVPQIGLERAVRLSWPDTGVNGAVESAPCVEGPWLPVLGTDLPGMRQITVPATDRMKFFRLQ